MLRSMIGERPLDECAPRPRAEALSTGASRSRSRRRGRVEVGERPVPDAVATRCGSRPPRARRARPQSTVSFSMPSSRRGSSCGRGRLSSRNMIGTKTTAGEQPCRCRIRTAFSRLSRYPSSKVMRTARAGRASRGGSSHAPRRAAPARSRWRAAPSARRTAVGTVVGFGQRSLTLVRRGACAQPPRRAPPRRSRSRRSRGERRS